MRLPEKIRARLRFPNTKITIVLNEPFTKNLCEDVQKTLKIKEDMTTTNYSVHGRYYRHVSRIRIKDLQRFKNNLGKLQDKYPGIVFYTEPISYRNQILLGPVIGTSGIVMKILITDLIWPFLTASP